MIKCLITTITRESKNGLFTTALAELTLDEMLNSNNHMRKQNGPFITAFAELSFKKMVQQSLQEKVFKFNSHCFDTGSAMQHDLSRMFGMH